VCPNSCAIVVEVDEGRVVRVSGDRANETYAGYTCVKGRAQPEYLRHPDRLLRSRKRNEDGALVEIAVDDAMNEIAERLLVLLDRHGPRSVAAYFGTYVIGSMATSPMANAFMDAIGSPMRFTPNTIDKPGKPIARAMHGSWMAPGQGFDRPDVALLLGANPLVTYTGLPTGNPGRWLSAALDGGMQLVVIDPRVTDVARRATLHLQPRPGEDVAILAAMMRVLLEEGLIDVEFVRENVSGVDALRRAVAPFNPGDVAARADLDPNDLVRAARIWGAARRGYAFAGTGPNMTGQGTLVEYLVLNLLSLRGFWLRAGERVHNSVALMPAGQAKAQAASPKPAYGYGERMRVRDLTETPAGLPTAALADEILMPGPGRVRALLSCAGNPVAAWPDQRKAIEAMRSLDLLVQVDPWLSQTARYADYVIAPKMSLETPGITQMIDFLAINGVGFGPAESYAQYSPTIVDPPEGSELIEEWEFFYGLAQRMGLGLTVSSQIFYAIDPVHIDMVAKPTTDALLDMITTNSRVSLADVKGADGGRRYDEPAVFVAPKDEGWEGRLDVGNTDMLFDLGREAARLDDRRHESASEPFPLRLVCRRMTHVYNSSCNVDATNRGRAYNPAFLHPQDLARYGVEAGEVVDIVSQHSTLPAVVLPDASLRVGMLSLTHNFGGSPDEDADVVRIGSTASRLLRDDVVFDRYSGQPLMSNVPVTIRPHRSSG
jgi:anaerobic selenocysteine-containing dehydrogenase